MIVGQILKNNILKIIDIAKLAPSVHNVQPWKVRVSGDTVIILIDKSNKLTYGDPTGRESFISLGIFSETLILAAKRFGLDVEKLTIKNKQAQITFKKSQNKTSKDEYENFIKSRSTDRSIYKKIDINKKTIDSITNIGSTKKVKVWAIVDNEKINMIAELTSKGISLALTSPDFRRELSGLLILPWSNKQRGIPVKSLKIPWYIETLEPVLIKLGLGLKSEARLEKTRWQSASAVIFITTQGDMQEDWLLAGRTYLTVSILIEKAGLSQATSAALVEASTFHEDIEKMLKTKQRIQCVLRIGRGSSKKVYSPRVPAEQLIST